MCTIFRENAAFGLKKWNCIHLENGTHVPKNAGEADIMFVPIKNVHLVGITNGVPTSEAARCKAWVCGHLLFGIIDSNPAGGMYVCHL
jgi:pyrrolidone-carboxylate peptidase